MLIACVALLAKYRGDELGIDFLPLLVSRAAFCDLSLAWVRLISSLGRSL